MKYSEGINFSKSLTRRAFRLIEYRLVSLRSRLFENIINYFDNLLTIKGFRLGIEVLGLESHSATDVKQIKSDPPDWALIFQGGFENTEQFDFFEQSVELFISKFKIQYFILSTFKLSPEIKKRFESTPHRKNIAFVESVDPGQLNSPFSPNLLRQIRTSYYGMMRAKELGYKKVVKIRIDQRFTGLCTLSAVDFILANFPSPVSKVRGRIICSSLGTFKSLPLFMSDFIQFGYVDDLINFWGETEKSNIQSEASKFQKNFGLDFSLSCHPEVWLSARYASTKYSEVLNLFQINDFFWSNLVAVIDASDIRLEWQKQPKAFMSNYKSTKWFESGLNSRYVEMTYWDWLVQFGCKIT